MANFKELLIWQKGMEIVQQSFIIAKQLPSEDLYTIRPQLVKSAISIPSNIAEGAGRNSQEEFKRFVNIAQGSCFEFETQIIIIDNNNLIPNYCFKAVYFLITEIQKMMTAFIKKLESNI